MFEDLVKKKDREINMIDRKKEKEKRNEDGGKGGDEEEIGR